MGRPVAHSRSPMIHGYWLEHLGLDGAYELRDLSPAAFPDFLAHLADHGYVGGNVTAPHKEAAFRGVHRRDAAAEAIGAVNTVWYEDGRLVGGNSDAPGFLANLDDRAPGWDDADGIAVVLGAGGAARAAVYGLRRRGLEVAVVNRTRERARELAGHFGEGVRDHHGAELHDVLFPRTSLLVNCTPRGAGGKDPIDLDLERLAPHAVVHDMVYVPLETQLLAKARARGHRVVDGLGMLLHQAGFGFARWFGTMPEVTPELRARIEADIAAKAAAASPPSR